VVGLWKLGKEEQKLAIDTIGKSSFFLPLKTDREFCAN